MENATKALLIAAAVLIVIIVIALGMRIFNSTSGVEQSATDTGEVITEETETASSQLIGLLGGASEGENQADPKEEFNSKFQEFIGTGKSKNDVSNLLDEVIKNNRTNTEHKITVRWQRSTSASYTDYDDPDQIQIAIKNTMTYGTYKVTVSKNENEYIYRIWIIKTS